MSGYDELKKLSEAKKLPISIHSGTAEAVKNISENTFTIETFLKKPWERG
jgi:hypothetical protein